MAAREDKIHTNRVRARIQVSQLVTRLENNALGELDKEMTTGQILSANSVLDRAMPKLKATDVEPNEDGELKPFAWDK